MFPIFRASSMRDQAFTLGLVVALSTPAVAGTTGFVRGAITRDGAQVAGTTVVLSGEGTTISTTSRADGTYSFPAVPYGRYVLSIRDGAEEAFRKPIEIASDSIVDVPADLSLKAIVRTQATGSRGVGGGPVSVLQLDRAAIAASPEGQSLDRLVETLPGIVRFSYNEPVAHGFHGLTYELDGVPLSQSTSSNFAEIIDPRSIDSLEVFTGAFPAEYGGSRQGAVVNILSRRARDLASPEEGTFTTGFGSYGELEASFGESATLGSTRFYLNLNQERSNRGIDSPTYVPQHDNANQSNQFFRTITNLGKNDSLAFDATNDDAAFQIPIDTNGTDVNDPIAAVPETDDVQRERSNALSLSYTHNASNGLAYTQISPFYKYDRNLYDGDLAKDVLATTSGQPNSNAGLREDRRSAFSGVRVVQFNQFGANALKAGIDADAENFAGSERIEYFPALADGSTSANATAFSDVQSRRGTNVGAYVDDKWTPSEYLSLRGGLRFDHSTGYVSGGQLSPRFEVDAKFDLQDIFHAYYGRLYAAPFLEDTRAAAVVVGGLGNARPTYDLKPERDQYYEFGIAHDFAPSARATVNFWKRDVENVLDTTQLANTPIFAVFNNTIGIAKGVEGRVDSHWKGGDSFYLSSTLSSSMAGGISGGTFLFPPASGVDPSDVTLSPEDHDQTFAMELGYTKRFGGDRRFFATVEPEYGTGYPVEFQNGSGRLPPHLTTNASVGEDPSRGNGRHVGFRADFSNFTNTKYILKIANGFNTTQYGPGFQTSVRITAPL